MRKSIALLPIVVLSLAMAAPPPRSHTMRVLSKTYTIDRKYRSMEGPSSVERIHLGDPQKPELLWITGIRTEMVQEDGTSPQLPELMCHVNIDLDAAAHQAVFGFQRPTAARLMTLSQGMLSARVPGGFGFPIASSESLVLFTQVLNLNIEKPDNLKVRHRVTVTYVRDVELTTPMKPLFNVGASGMVALEGNPLALQSMATSAPGASSGAPSGEHAGASCLMGARAPNATSTSADYVDPKGRHMTGHWIVPPGRQVNASDVTWFMGLPFDTRLHYAAAHLHPFAREIALRDTTTGKDVFRIKATNPATGIGLARVDRFFSAEGIPLYRSHTYDLVSVYDNPTKENADSMASLFLGLDDPDFVKPTSDELRRRSSALLTGKGLLFETGAGEVRAILARDAAPETTVQVLRLVDAGVLAGARVNATEGGVDIVIPITPEVYRLFQPVRSEPGILQEANVLAFCPPGPGGRDLTLRVLKARPSMSICTGFARIEGSFTALSEAATSVDPKILRARVLAGGNSGTAIASRK